MTICVFYGLNLASFSNFILFQAGGDDFVIFHAVEFVSANNTSGRGCVKPSTFPDGATQPAGAALCRVGYLQVLAASMEGHAAGGYNGRF